MPSRVMRCGGRPVIDTPSRRTAPPVSGNSPVTQLNAVVLPAPLGPIMEMISRSPMSKLTELTASRPPNRLVTASSSSSAMSGLALHGSQRLRGHPRLQLDAAGAAGQEATGTEQHHDDQRNAVHHVRVLTEVEVSQRRDADGLADRRRPLVEVGQDPEDGEGQHEGADD